MQLATGLLSPKSGQDKIVRGYLFGRADQIVKPYNYTVTRFTTRISNLRNRLGMCGIKDEGFLSLRSLELNRRLVAMSCPWATPFPIQDLRRRSSGSLMKLAMSTSPADSFRRVANGRIARRLLKKKI